MAVDRRIAALLGAILALGAGGAALASGVYATLPWYLDQYGGDPPDRQARYDGRLGIVMARAPDPLLFASWRLLHGQAVGRQAGAKLELPCCSKLYDADAPRGGPWAWLDARKIVPGAAAIEMLPTGRDGPNFTVVENCYDGAFDAATATLKARADSYGAASPEVAAWLKAQDAVFDACGNAQAVLPAPMDRPPAWLATDRAYQEAAFSLYQGRHEEAAQRFAVIGRDAASPYRGMSLYLVARSRVRAVLAQKTEEAYAQARSALNALAAAPEGTYGLSDAHGLMRVIDYRMRPNQLLDETARQLDAPILSEDAASAFRDLNTLGGAAEHPPELIGWIRTLKSRNGLAPASEDDGADDRARANQAALAHARQRWTATRDPVWLIAALSLADPGPDAGSLVADGAGVAANHPAWLTVQYHSLRLTLPTADPALSRQKLDGLLARTDLSVTDRNLFTAQRAQVAADMGDFVRFALRKRLCVRSAYDQPDPCIREYWFESALPFGRFDQDASRGQVGFGEDARAAIDRMPLAMRLDLARRSELPAKLRLDIGLTNFTRAVQLQNNAALDGSARDLAVLLPQMAAEFKGVAAAKPGPDKRFAAFLILAKVPGLRIDLVDHHRPAGSVPQFTGTWIDWIVPGAGRPPGGTAPRLAQYQQDGAGVAPDAPDSLTDLTCLGECGRGVAPLRLPDFVAAGQAQAAKERAYFFSAEHAYDEDPPPTPAGATAAWDEMLAYARAHPADPRVPEALYWLVRVGRWGGTHDHSGKRAFQLLKTRHPASAWAKKTPYYYD